MKALAALRTKKAAEKPAEASKVADEGKNAVEDATEVRNSGVADSEGAGGTGEKSSRGKRATDHILLKRGDSKKRKANARDIRLAKDWSEYQDCEGVKVEFPDATDTSVFSVHITPQAGYWKGATYTFDVNVPLGYPHEPPVCTLRTVPIYHPNINFEGKICLNVLRDGWQPVLTVTHVLYGLLLLFDNPNPHDPLPNGIDGEWEAANLLRKEPAKFAQLVRETLEGGYIRRLGMHFPPLLTSQQQSKNNNNNKRSNSSGAHW